MWASKTDYSKLYSADYFGKSDGAASYNGSDFERVFFGFCNENSITSLVDVGTGSGKLKQTATSAGMTVFACDFDPVEQDALHFDLSSDNLADAIAVRTRIADLLGGSNYVTTCLDVLEHIDIEDVGSALFNLREITSDFAIVSISTRPSSRGNKYHSTILPIATWQHAFELCGFDIVDSHFCPEGRRVTPLDSQDPTLKIISHWAQADVFKDRLDGEPTYFLVRKTGRANDEAIIRGQVDRILDIAYRRRKRLSFDSGQLEAIAFNISHFQDFFNIRPILDLIPRGQASVLLRHGALMEDEKQLVTGFFERCGVPIFHYRAVQDINWAALGSRTLISAAESSAAFNHALSAQLVEAANLHGINTVLLQHGIWIEPMQDRQISFSSNTILSWGAEHERFFRVGQHAVAGLQKPYGIIDGHEMLPAGSPKFYDALLEPNPEVLKWRLGIAIESFEEAVLVGTNLKWHAHGGPMPNAMRGIERMIVSNPDKLFVIKPHPSERNFEYSHLKARNTVVLDDILTGCMDLPISRLMGGISTVVTSLSTLLLDGALLNRRCIQYDTGNKFSYEGCKPFSPADLPRVVADPVASSLDAKEFCQYYNDAGNDEFYDVLARCVNNPPQLVSSAKRYTDLKSTEDMWLILSDMRKHVDLLESERQSYHEAKQENIRLTNVLAAMHHSASWRMTAPYRKAGHQLRRLAHLLRTLPRLAKSRGGYLALAKSAARVYSTHGMLGVVRAWRRVNNRPAQELPSNDYAAWLNAYATMDDKLRDLVRLEIASWENKPLISIVMPVYNPDLKWLDEAIASVREQLYTNWELCIADDCSTSPGVQEFLSSCVANDARIKVTYRPVNGHISEASNSALELATGDWMALLDQDDLLTEDALYYLCRAINANLELELVYSDEDKIEEGRRFSPYFKPDWNKELLRTHNMISHLGAYRMERVRSIGGFRKGFEGSQDYDLVLRFAERLEERNIAHIPRVLYHWRTHANSTAQSKSAKSYAAIAGEKALSEHLERMAVKGFVETLDTGMYRVHYRIPDKPPLVSLIIPTRNSSDLVRQCVTSILEKTTYPAYEIIIVDNNSDDPDTLAYFQDIQNNPRVRVERDERPFNYSALNNRAVELAVGEYIGLVNNDIEVIDSNWLSEMMGFASQKGTGAVGARLWYPDDTLQHGGVIVGLGGVAGHSHKMLRRDDPGYFRRAELPQNLSAVTAACLIVKKETFKEVGGLNERDLGVAFNDVDFCMKLQDAGYRNVWTPYADLYHHESATRGAEDTPEKVARFNREVEYMNVRWNTRYFNDPAYNSNLTLNHEDFSLAWPPRHNGDPTLAS